MSSDEIILELIGDLKLCIERDLQAFEEGERLNFLFLRYVPGIGMLASNCWIECYLPGYSHKWEKFMFGQSCMPMGFFPTNVVKFLRAVERDIENDRVQERQTR